MGYVLHRPRLHACVLLAGAITLAGCASAPPIVTITDKGNIVVAGIPSEIRCIQVTVTRQGIKPPDLQFPNPGSPGFPNAPVDHGSVTIPTTQSATPVTITAITVTIPPDCAPTSGTWTYTGGPFELSRSQDRSIPWDQFAKR